MLEAIQYIQTTLKDAIAQTRHNSSHILVSAVMKIERIDPLAFYAYGEKEYKGSRFFWREPTDNLIIASFGYAYKFFRDNDMQIDDIEQEWKQLLHNARFFGEQIEGTGPILVGGQVFDPLKPKTSLWNHYADLHYYIPMFVLTIHKDECYLTINIVIDAHTPDDQIDRIIETFYQIQECKNGILSQKSTIIDQTELYVPEWMSAVQQAISAIKRDLFHKVVLARELRVHIQNVHLPSIMHHLLQHAKSSYIFSLESQEDCFIGASPERLLRKKGTTLYTTCLAGSIPRLQDDREDEYRANQLLQDPKNRQEHQYVVDMIRSVLEPVCVTLNVPKTPIVMKLPHLYHLYTPIQGVVNQKVSLMQMISMLHPTPALGGLPKKEAVTFIREHEPMDRGLFGAPLGWIDSHGNGEFLVAIRSALLQKDKASIFAGCGIVAESIPEMEYEETKVKMQPMLIALGGMSNE